MLDRSCLALVRAAQRMSCKTLSCLGRCTPPTGEDEASLEQETKPVSKHLVTSSEIVGCSFGGHIRRHTNTSRTYHLNKDETCMSFLNTLVMVPMQCLAVSEEAEMHFVALYQPDTSSIISLSLD